MSDAFVAVFEQDTPAGLDTLRVVVPSEQAARELVEAVIREAAERFTGVDQKGQEVVEFPRAHSTLLVLGEGLLAFPDEASYVSDRLSAVMRAPPGARPRINVYGLPLSGHAILGAAIELRHGEAPLPLFPVDVIMKIQAAGERAAAVAKGVPLPPLDARAGEATDKVDWEYHRDLGAQL